MTDKVTDTARGNQAGRSWRNRFRAFRRKRIHPFWQSIKWPLLGGVWISGFTLGYVGFYIRSQALGEEATILDSIYRTLQLIVFESGDIEGVIPWQLEVSRFLLPLVAGYTALHAVIVLFREQWQHLRIRFLRNHIVICGLGERGYKFTEEFLEYGCQVVIVEKNEENVFLDHVRKRGAFVIIGDAADEMNLHKARVYKSRSIIATCADDGTNAEIALGARSLALSRKRVYALTAFVHIIDFELCNLIRGWCFAAADADSFRLEFFNVLERGARLMLKEYPPYKEENLAEERSPRILVVGLGELGRSLVVQAARNWWMKYKGTDKLMRIAVVDDDAEKKVELLRLQNPHLEDSCRFETWQLNDDSPEFEQGEFIFGSNGGRDLDIVYICFDDDARVLVKALIIHNKTKKNKVPIVLRMARDSGLANLVKEDYGTLDFGQIKVFCLLNRTCSLNSLLGGDQEILARTIHEDYLANQKELGIPVDDNISMVPWDNLPDGLKESNRSQAAHIETKLKAVGCGIQPITDWDAANFKFTPEEIELLAEMEHERWCRERLRQGWSYNPGPKNIKKKTSPYLLPWENLPEEIREYDRKAARGLPSYLARVGYQIYKRN